MKKAIAFFFALNLLTTFAEVTETPVVDKDSDDASWITKIWNGTTITSVPPISNPLATKDSSKDFYDKLTCTVAVQKANKALTDFVSLIKEATDEWAAFSASEKLNKFCYYLQKGCEGRELKLKNQGAVGGNLTQDEACGHLGELVGSLLVEDDDDDSRILSASFLANLETSKKALMLKDSIGAECKLAVVEEIEVEQSEVETVIPPSFVFLSSKSENHGHSEKNDDDEEEGEKEEKESKEKADDEEEDEDEEEEDAEKEKKEEEAHEKKQIEEEEEEDETENVGEGEANLTGFVLRVDDVEDDHIDSYTISYHQEPNGDADVVIAHVTIREYIEDVEENSWVSL